MEQHRRNPITANDKAWAKLFLEKAIPSKVEALGYLDISSSDIKKYREPRLMCKMDFRQSVPKPFRDHGFSILAIQNGLYRIAKTSPFFDIDTDQISTIRIVEFQLPPFVETLDFENITGESQALDAAVASGMLDALLGEQSYLTVRGRRFCTSMTVTIPETDGKETQDYPISSVQIEVDGGYEGETVLALIEAKMGTADNMNMRQLIYPHVHFEQMTKKVVRTFVMFYETGSIFTFIPMTYQDGIPSLTYENAKRFKLVASDNATSQEAKAAVPLPTLNYDAPFPQADDFSKVLYGLYKLSEIQPASKEDLFGNFAIHPRQYDYYFNAMRWLGLADRGGNGDCMLTPIAESLIERSEKERLAALRQTMLQDALINRVQIQGTDIQPTAKELADRKMSEDTFMKRRIKTVLSWLNFTEAVEDETNLI